VSAGRYDGTLREIIHAFKYEGRRTLADPLGRFMRESGESLLDDCDFIVPVPLHPWRRMRRGFNQSRDLAERLDRPVVSALWRTRASPAQTTLDAEARRLNVRGVFVLSPICTGQVDAARIVLIDDVRTTGATVDECAKMLMRGGAREVRALTLAFA
jgi:ComF family protein